MQARTIEDLQVWHRARELERAVHALLDAPKVRNDRVLSDQMNAASLSAVSNISGGFEQTTDRAFARYLVVARGSAAELRTQIQICIDRHHPPVELTDGALSLCSEVIRMLTPLIRYLRNQTGASGASEQMTAWLYD